MAARPLSGEGAIAVDGMKEALSGLRRARKDLPRVVTKASRDLTREIMLPDALSNWSSQNIRPSVAKRAVKAVATGAGAGLNLKDSTLGFAAGVEYGSKQYAQFRQWRGNRFTVSPGSTTGYVVQDAIRDNIQTFEDRWLGEVLTMIDKAVQSG